MRLPPPGTLSRINLFCDFDGTITLSDNIIAIMREFAPPEWETLKDRIMGREISIREGVSRLFALLPTSAADEIQRFALKQARIRDGFGEFVRFAKARSLPLYVVSGGIDFFVWPLLAPYALDDRVYCNESDMSGERIRITWPHPCDPACDGDCGLCKPTLIRKLARPGDFNIVIGDSVTDLRAADTADWVYACDYLLERCGERGLPHSAFATFYDIMEHLERHLAERGNR